MKYIFLIAVFFIVACGSGNTSSNSKKKPVNQDAVSPSEYIGDFCSPAVLNDFLQWRKLCKTTKTKEEVKRCKGMTQEIIDRYPGMNCELPQVKDMNGEALPSSITDADFKDFIELLKSFGH